MSYEIEGVVWDSKEEYDKYNSYMVGLQDTVKKEGYSWEFKEGESWTIIRKKLGKDFEIVCYAKIYMEGSEFGIKNGKISKMSISQRDVKKEEVTKQYYNYDRGLDFNDLKQSKAAKEMYDMMIKIFN